MTDSNSPEYEQLQVDNKSTLRILQLAPHLTIRDPETFAELEKSLRLIDSSEFALTERVVQEQSLALNSSVLLHVKDANKNPTYTIKIYPKERMENYQREKSWFKILEANDFPEAVDSSVTIPKYFHDKSQGRSHVLGYE